MRTNANFLHQTQPEHHLGIPPLSKVHNFRLISNVQLDYRGGGGEFEHEVPWNID